ncbi:hypothetical protein [Peptacetobacter sp.]|uniref:hypothetical protein n=1 Tax=Peptacetobacter sp. TaxID=2991975 RepID=UPI002E75B0AB|nr:hypothetical protein [Peptacetobacter sp.]MEE0451001.1 hypothetical protein [Peptacetobacter sp.]
MGFVVVILIIVAFIIYKKRSKKESGEIFSEESLVNSVNELNDKIAERNNTIKEIQEVNSNCEKRMEGIKNAISSMDDSVAEEDKEIFNEKLKSIENEINRNNTKIKNIEKEIEDLNKEILVKNEKLDELKKKEIEAAKQEELNKNNSSEGNNTVIKENNAEKNGVKKDTDKKYLDKSDNTSKFKKIFRKEVIIPFVIGLLIGAFLFSSGDTSKYEDQIAQQQTQIAEKDKKIKELQGKVDEAAPWFEMTAAEQEKKEAELKAAKEAKEKEEAEKLAAEQKKKEEEEKKGYDTGITYSQLARTPDDYLAKKVKFSGKVVQVMEDGDSVGIRLAVDGDYDNIILGTFDSSIISERILEDDYITVYGLSAGIYTYESTMGASISVPSMTIDKISR